MSGGNVPYHLRQNKAIDRNLFMELLAKINRFKPIDDYTYVGFGGPFLEDFKLIHSHFNNTKMVSIEYDDNVYLRQQFNMPLGCIQCLPKKSGEFIDEYNIDGNSIVWLDFAESNKIGDQTREFASLLNKLQLFDVVRITLNANPECYGNPEGPADEKRIKRFNKLEGRLAGEIPSDISADEMDLFGLPGALCKVLRNVASAAMVGRQNEFFKPLSAYAYSDTAHQMLTLTGIILSNEFEQEFLDKTLIDAWNLSKTDWSSPERIRVPEMTIRERNFIDSKLPQTSGENIHQEITFQFEADEQKSLSLLLDYVKYYRYYPYFSKIVV